MLIDTVDNGLKKTNKVSLVINPSVCPSTYSVCVQSLAVNERKTYVQKYVFNPAARSLQAVLDFKHQI